MNDTLRKLVKLKLLVLLDLFLTFYGTNFYIVCRENQLWKKLHDQQKNVIGFTAKPKFFNDVFMP